MIAFPHCKINLGLHVVSRRPDGYHNLETCFYPIPWTDIIEILPAEKFELVLTGEAVPGKEESNLCARAYRALAEDFGLPPAHIHLHKILPMGAGLGGGSSDGAFTLKLLNEVFSLGLGPAQLASYASRLGSDCAFFLQDGPCIGLGKGDQLKPLPLSLKGKYIAIVKPDVSISTSEAYGGVTAKQPPIPLEQILEEKDLGQWKHLLKNDFEESVFRAHPELREFKETLYASGALYASLTGSGAALYGLFDQAIQLPEKLGSLRHWSGQL